MRHIALFFRLWSHKKAVLLRFYTISSIPCYK
jgi:hypothetical protein